MSDARHLRRTVATALLCLSPLAGAEVRGELALEARQFLAGALDEAQQDSHLSLSAEVEVFHRWDGDRQSFTLKPFARVDRRDDARTHVDLREAVWIYHDGGFETRVGVDKVFWGVTEVYHLVDIINQTDLVENPDGEQKLGQPLAKFSLEGEQGTLDLYLMPRFRERPYPSREGRPRTQPRVADELARFENRRAADHPDVALRWSRVFGDWDLGVSYFHGTGREPELVPGLDDDGRPVLIPRYQVIHQASLDLQGVVGDWLWKFETLHRRGQRDPFTALTGGFEYTLYGFRDSDADLGLLAELMWDERGDGATTPFNHDLFAGLRWVANDVDGSEILAGVVQDWSNGSRFFNLEASRRLGNLWKLGLQARLWSGVAPDDPLSALRNDDYVELKVSRYF